MPIELSWTESLTNNQQELNIEYSKYIKNPNS